MQIVIMRMAISGTTGRVGRALADRFRAWGHEVADWSREGGDLRGGGALKWLEESGAELLFHPAGMTSLEACEDDPEGAWRVNAEAPGELAAACRRLGTRMVAFSTDYVFGGREPGWRAEGDEVGPLSIYGRSKAEGERRVVEEGGAVVRVSWVFGPEKAAFPERVRSELRAGRAVEAVADKWSMPTFTADLAEWMKVFAGEWPGGGVYHACQAGEPASWYDLALAVREFLVERGEGGEVPEVRATSLAGQAGFRAERPRHTAMSCERLESLGVVRRDWREALREHLAAAGLSR